DLLALAADVVGCEPPHRPDRGGVVADGQILVAACASGARHLRDARPAIRPGGVTVQVSANLLELDERRRWVAEGRLPQLGGAPGHAQGRVDLLFTRSIREWLE